jgi:TonB-dependent SusC/RagA subfamily outer membrane receptor
MKKLILLSLCTVLLSGTALASELEKFHTYLMQSIRYPSAARLASHQGNSIITFTLAKGSLKHVNIETELGKGCDVAILNSIMAYPQIKNIKDGQYALKTSFIIQSDYTPLINEGAKLPAGFTALEPVTIMAPAAPNTNPIGIKIVGYGTKKDPLYIIDGKTEMSLQELDPKTIESLTILKDASTIALYGKEAANGVIVITTKKATSSAAKVVLRGTNAYSKDPLFVVDGEVKEHTSLHDFDPNNIQSITVLKDASAIALYGAEAAKGVVIIETKAKTKAKPKK